MEVKKSANILLLGFVIVILALIIPSVILKIILLLAGMITLIVGSAEFYISTEVSVIGLNITFMAALVISLISFFIYSINFFKDFFFGVFIISLVVTVGSAVFTSLIVYKTISALKEKQCADENVVPSNSCVAMQNSNNTFPMQKERVNDCGERLIEINPNNRTNRDDCKSRLYSFVVLDFETTGFSSFTDHIIQIGAIKYVDSLPIEQFCTYVKPPVAIPIAVSNLTGIYDSTVENAPAISEVINKLMDFISDFTIICHNAAFDLSFLIQNLKKHSIAIPNNTVIDTLKFSRATIYDVPNYKLSTLKQFLHINDKSHDALSDCRTTGKLFLYCCSLNPNFECQKVEDFIKFEPAKPKPLKTESEPLTEKDKQYYKTVYQILDSFDFDLSDICCTKHNSFFNIIDTYIVMKFKFSSKSSYWLTEIPIDEIKKFAPPDVACTPSPKSEGARTNRVHLTSPEDLLFFKSLIKKQYEQCLERKKSYYKYYKAQRHFDGEFKIDISLL